MSQTVYTFFIFFYTFLYFLYFGLDCLQLLKSIANLLYCRQKYKKSINRLRHSIKSIKIKLWDPLWGPPLGSLGAGPQSLQGRPQRVSQDLDFILFILCLRRFILFLYFCRQYSVLAMLFKQGRQYS